MNHGQAMERLGVLGPRYLADPSLAGEMMEALVCIDNAPAVINQAWLDCHWDYPDALRFLVDCYDCWGRQPEPLGDFFQACWARNDIVWHRFVDVDTIEDDAHLADLMYDRFALEGPTESVVRSMMYLRVSLDSDQYADDIMPQLINSGINGPNARGLLKLWRRYGVTDHCGEAIVALNDHLAGDLADDAVRAVECLRMKHLTCLMDSLSQLTGSASGIASRCARRLIVGASDTHYDRCVANAITQVPWHNYMTRFHPRTLWRMVDYMMEQGALRTMIDLWNAQPNHGLVRGLFTRIMAMNPAYSERAEIVETARLDPFPTTMHTSIYYMYMRGMPPPAMQFFHDANRAWPDAVKALGRAPAIAREIKWARRKGLLVAMSTTPATARKKPRGPRGVLTRLHEHPATWPVVFKYL